MGLMSMININDNRKQRKTSKANDVNTGKRDNGFSVYESLEYVKNGLGQNSLRLQMEMIKNLVR